MTTTFTILGSIFSVIAVACYNLKHIYLGLLFAVLALICFAAALFKNFNNPALQPIAAPGARLRLSLALLVNTFTC